MTIQNSTRDGQSYINKIVPTVSQASLNDSVFLEKSELISPITEEVNNEILSKVNHILKSKGLIIVERALKQTRLGSFRTFVGSLDYQTSTSLE